MKTPTGSRTMAWSLFVTTVLLTGFAIYKDMEGLASTVFITGVPSAVALYMNKQWTEVKALIATNKN
jgi:hypothetical protein